MKPGYLCFLLLISLDFSKTEDDSNNDSIPDEVTSSSSTEVLNHQPTKPATSEPKLKSSYDGYHYTRDYIQNMAQNLKRASATIGQSYGTLNNLLKSREESFTKNFKIFLRSILTDIHDGQNTQGNSTMNSASNERCFSKMHAAVQNLEKDTIADTSSCFAYVTGEVASSLRNAITFSDVSFAKSEILTKRLISCGEADVNYLGWNKRDVGGCLRQLEMESKPYVHELLAAVEKTLTIAVGSVVTIPLKLSMCAGESLSHSSNRILKVIQGMQDCSDSEI